MKFAIVALIGATASGKYLSQETDAVPQMSPEFVFPIVGEEGDPDGEQFEELTGEGWKAVLELYEAVGEDYDETQFAALVQEKLGTDKFPSFTAKFEKYKTKVLEKVKGKKECVKNKTCSKGAKKREKGEKRQGGLTKEERKAKVEETKKKKADKKAKGKN